MLIKITEQIHKCRRRNHPMRRKKYNQSVRITRTLMIFNALNGSISLNFVNGKNTSIKSFLFSERPKQNFNRNTETEYSLYYLKLYHHNHHPPNIRQKQIISAEMESFCRKGDYVQKRRLSAEIILFLKQLIKLDYIICLLKWTEKPL